MGLDACVYCDCVEKGRLRTPPPHANLLYIEEDGSPEVRSDDLELCIEFDEWRDNSPCPHDQLCIAAHRLGNMSGIGWIRSVIAQISAEPETAFPVLWTQVIYSGIHAGDFLTPEQAVRLGAELEQIERTDYTKYAAEQLDYFKEFLQMLAELVKASKLVSKPIAF